MAKVTAHDLSNHQHVAYARDTPGPVRPRSHLFYSFPTLLLFSTNMVANVRWNSLAMACFPADCPPIRYSYKN